MARSLWAAFAEKELREQFPKLRAGVTNCRRIAGTNIWSQHAWSNALDLYDAEYGYSSDRHHQAFLDDVDRWIRTYQDELSIRTRLWRVRSHFDHIHIDGWPRGYHTPPCAGGILMMQFNSGAIVRGDPGPANGTPDLPNKELIEVSDNQTLERTMEGWAVADLQRDLIGLGFDLGNWEPYAEGFPPGADGKFGGASEQGVTDFQTGADLIVTGKADGVTLHFIREKLGYAKGEHHHRVPNTGGSI